MNAHTPLIPSGFDGRMLVHTLPKQVIGGWSRQAVIEEAATRWLNDNRLRDGNRWDPMYPEAETLGAQDIVSLATLVSKHLGAELFGKALDADLDVNRLTHAFKRNRLDVAGFIASFNSGIRDRRYFGAAPVVTRKRVYRDNSGFTRREKLEMSAACSLDRERLADFGAETIAEAELKADEGSAWRESDVMESDGFEIEALWPAAEELESMGVDLVALEKVRSEIGTQELGNLNAKGVSLFKLAQRRRNGLDTKRLVRAFNSGLSVAAFNSAKFPSGEYNRDSRVHRIDGHSFQSSDLSTLLGHPQGWNGGRSSGESVQ